MGGRRATCTLMSLLLTLAVALAAVGAVAPAPVAAAEPIRVVETSHENLFPNALRFRLKAEGDATITQATLQYKVQDHPITSYSPAKIAPGRKLSVDHQLDLKRFYEPPGVELRYRWQLRDETGRTVETGWTGLTLDDPRFAWRVLEADNLEVRWYSGGDDFGNLLLSAGRTAIAKLREEAGVQASGKVRILVYGSQADFQTASPPGGHEWAGGRAFVREGVVLIAAGPNNLDYALRTVPHELSHVVVYQATKNPYGGLPTWLDEGLAMTAEGNLPASYGRALRAAIAADRLISVWSLSSSFPTDARLAELSYAQSESVVSFIVERYGREGVSRLLDEFRAGAAYDDALRAALGTDTYGLEEAWRESIGAKPLPALPTVTPVPATATPVASASGLTPTAAAGASPAAAAKPLGTPVALATPAPAPTEPTPADAPVAQSAGCGRPLAAGALLFGGLGAAGGVRRRQRRSRTSGSRPD